jgi:hypothetical protein
LHVSVTGIVAAAWHVQQAEDRTMMVAESRVVASAGLERPLLGCSSPALAACFSRDGKKKHGIRTDGSNGSKWTEWKV